MMPSGMTEMTRHQIKGQVFAWSALVALLCGQTAVSLFLLFLSVIVL